MPVIKVQLPDHYEKAEYSSLLAKLSKLCSEALNKPERYTMVTISTGPMMMEGMEGVAAFVEVRAIGDIFNAQLNAEMSKKICELISAELCMPHNRIYINFENVASQNWGFDGGIL